ncbi:hypothetical protein D1007_42131 [Hordeum vulgare]|nr:hypothetical protein D1007_42131 [Hordeum vulgare]
MARSPPCRPLIPINAGGIHIQELWVVGLVNSGIDLMVVLCVPSHSALGRWILSVRCRPLCSATIVVGAEGIENLIPTKRWLKRVNQPGKVTFMSLPCSRGRASRTVHEEGSGEPLRFYVQTKGMKEWVAVKIPRAVRLSVNKLSEFWVQAENF